MANDPATIAIAKETAEDLDLVISCAHSYAGEIGFSDPEYAIQLFAACARLQPEVYRPDGTEIVAEVTS